ncbi:MAG: cytochrome c biogenesis protein CcdA [Magnetococcus sp. YQC-3]
MSGLAVLGSGFASFFSIWQLCILQISPFFMVYIVGLNAAVFSAEWPGRRRWFILPGLAYPLGFSLVFSLLSASSLPVSRLLNYQIESWRLVAGLFFFLVALFFLSLDRWSRLRARPSSLLVLLFSLLLGAAFALIYSPCITPTMSIILGLGVHPESAAAGAILAWWYGLGMALAFGVVGALLVLALQRRGFWQSHARRVKDGCAAIFLILAGMNVTGVMVYYKAFFLGLLVR